MIFKSDKLFYSYIESVCPLFSFAKSFKPSRFSFITTEGVLVKNGNMPQMMASLNTLMGFDHFSVQRSRAKGRYTYQVYLTSDIVVEEAEQEVPVLISLEATPEPIPEDLTPKPTIDTSGIDWPRLESLQNTKEDKAFLAEFANKYEVALKCNMKIENMLIAFKSGLSI